ncbi:MAG TPA: hypothetical protein VEM96_15110 [Pyrinomonadaceae bacterium]|nr:hypothetical protein [Pyrinomonadaceae bacterium]
MRNNLLLKTLLTAALLILAIPIGASAQVYRDRYNDRYNDRYDYRNQYDQVDRRQVRDAIRGLDNSAARLEGDLSVTRGRRVLGVFWVGNTDNTAIAEVREFRLAVRQLRDALSNGRDRRDSYDEARMVLDRGMQLDRYLRVRTGSSQVDADLSELRSNLHVLADAYNLRLTY